ncbi:MAG: hypothetical protein WBB24_00980 [Maribacter sp.]
MRNNYLVVFIVTVTVIVMSSCRKDFEYAPSNGNLTFSKDTVYLDTVFANLGSSTYTLKVYNPTRDDVVIPTINLKKGTESFYRLNVDGVAGKQFTNVPIYAQDSLFILIETTISIDDESITELLYTDDLLFDSPPYQQSIPLVTLAKDAILLYADADETQESLVLKTDANGTELRVNAFELKDNQLQFTNERPYVIYGYGKVTNGKKLTIEPGARLFFHENSGIVVQKGGQIIANGELSQNQELLEGEIIFEGDRLEPEFARIHGQWGGIWLSDGSIENIINYSTIKNANIGLYVGEKNQNTTNSLSIANSKIYNSSLSNLWAKNGMVRAENLVLGGAGMSSLLISNGGEYSFIHSTIANYWTNGFRSNPALSISNDNTNDALASMDLVQADFINCIVDGNNQTELYLESNENNLFNFNFQNCLIKYAGSGSSDLYDFENNSNYSNIILNAFPDFYDSRDNNFKIGLASEIINLGNVNSAALVPFDILGISRMDNPDLGAYQAQEKVE